MSQQGCSFSSHRVDRLLIEDKSSGYRHSWDEHNTSPSSFLHATSLVHCSKWSWMDCTQSCHTKCTLCLSGRSGSENCNCTANSSVQQHHQVGILSDSHSTCAWRDHSCWHCTSGRHGHYCRSMKRDRNCGHHNTWRLCRQLEEQPSHCSTADG